MKHNCPKCGTLSFVIEEKIQYCEKCNYMQGENEHGGKRANAGRKSKYKEPTQTISFRVPKSLIEPITKYVKRALAKSKK